MQDPACVFCRIVSGTISARIVTQNDGAIAFLDAFPLALGHVLVTPKSHYSKVQEMSKTDSTDVFQMVSKLAGVVERVAEVDATIIAIHNGKNSGQEVPHVHVHIVPRRAGDGAGPVHSMFRNRPHMEPKEMDAILQKMKLAES